MKKVFPNSMVAHVWAQRTQSEGRNPGGSFYFEGDTIYSYGSHFAVARFVGANLCLLTSRGYSNTTSKHIGYVRQAIPGTYTIVRCPYPDRDAAGNTKWFESQLTAHLDAANAMRPGEKVRRAKRMALAADVAQHFNAYLEALPKSERGSAKPFAVDMTEYAATMAALREREVAAMVRRETAHRARMEEDARKWLAGEIPRLYGYRDADGSALLRVDLDTVQTSLGAEVPLLDVVRALKLYRKVWWPGQPAFSVRADLADGKLGHFRFDSIDADGNVKAGCHFISRAVIEKLQAQLS